MALTTGVFVGKTKDWIPEIAEKAKGLVLGRGDKSGVDLSPVAYKELKERIDGLLDTVEKEGGKFLLDGRGFVHPEYP